MGTETKVNCYTKNSSTGIIRAPKSSSTKNSQCSSKTLASTEILEEQQSTLCEVPFLPIEVDEFNVIDGAKQILLQIRPNWDLNFVEYKKFTDGITNKLVGCFYNPEVASITNAINNTNIGSVRDVEQNDSNDKPDNNDSGNLSDADTENDAEVAASASGTTNNVVLIRVYGNKTDLLIDRKAETSNIILLHSYGFAPTLYATFKNGLAYDYVPGITLNTESVLREEVWSLVAKRLADMHRLVRRPCDINSDSSTPVPMMWKKMQAFFDLVPERFSDVDKQKRLEGTFLPISRMREEFADLYRHLESLNSPIVFAHNDLLLGNVVYTESLPKVTFIDYEYADYNFQAYDIGNHFAEFAGVDTVDYTRYPSKEFQFKWLRVYLQSYLQKINVSDAEVNLLYVQVNQFALACHIFWTVWSLIQAEHSTINFDYVEYAYIRYNEYLARKQQFLALDGGPKCKI